MSSHVMTILAPVDSSGDEYNMSDGHFALWALWPFDQVKKNKGKGEKNTS